MTSLQPIQCLAIDSQTTIEIHLALKPLYLTQIIPKEGKYECIKAASTE